MTRAGATTGPMTVPFIMALGVGVAAVRGGRGKDDSFGLIGLASIGPVLSVLILGMLHHGRTGDVPEVIEAQASTLLGHFLALVPEVAGEVGMALGPLVGLFVIFRIFLLQPHALPDHPHGCGPGLYLSGSGLLFCGSQGRLYSGRT